MRNSFAKLFLIFTLSIGLSSCHRYTYSVGEGAQTGVEIKEKNHYVVYGLVPIKTSDPIQMAGKTENYTVAIQHSFVDDLVTVLTLGLYSPTTTSIKR